MCLSSPSASLGGPGSATSTAPTRGREEGCPLHRKRPPACFPYPRFQMSGRRPSILVGKDGLGCSYVGRSELSVGTSGSLSCIYISLRFPHSSSVLSCVMHSVLSTQFVSCSSLIPSFPLMLVSNAQSSLSASYCLEILLFGPSGHLRRLPSIPGASAQMYRV